MTETALFTGWLRAERLRAAVLGRAAPGREVRLPDHRVVDCTAPAAAAERPALLRAPGAAAPGVLVEGLSAGDLMRIDWFAADRRMSEIQFEGRPVRVWLAEEDDLGAARPEWDFTGWAGAWEEILIAAVPEIMAMRGVQPPSALRQRWPMLMVRAASALRAAAPRPATLRRAAAPGDVEVLSRGIPYARFFAVEDWRLRHARFEGGAPETVERAAFVSGDAVVVLPYDPARDEVLLVEQFRTGPFARGDANPWSLEAIAGRVDAGETPEAAARREAAEEAGLRLGALLPGPHHYPSPGAKTEYLYCYLGLCDLSAARAGGGGLPEEGEDIRAHVVSFDHLMRLLETGEIENGPLVVMALWLAARRAGLRAL